MSSEFRSGLKLTKCTKIYQYHPAILNQSINIFGFRILLFIFHRRYKRALEIAFSNSSVIRRKDEFQNGCFKKARHIFWKTNISYPQIHTRTSAYQGVRNVRFSQNLAWFVFLKHLFWNSSFCLITDKLYKKNLLTIPALSPEQF